jgi:hypothetical protein
MSNPKPSQNPIPTTFQQTTTTKAPFFISALFFGVLIPVLVAVAVAVAVVGGDDDRVEVMTRRKSFD